MISSIRTSSKGCLHPSNLQNPGHLPPFILHLGSLDFLSVTLQHIFGLKVDIGDSEAPVSDLQSLSELLQRLLNEPTQTIIRGSLITDQSNPVSRNKEMFAATVSQRCIIDIDSVEQDGDIHDQEAMLAHAVQ